MKKIPLLLLAISLSITMGKAQDVAVAVIDEDPKLTFSGSVDTYFRTNLNADDNGDNPAPATSFAGNTGFAIGMTNLILSYEGEKVGFVTDLVFGPRGESAVFLSDAISNLVNQLYVYWQPTDALTFTLGNFNTFLGYEVISPAGNFHYSTSYMFSYGPFSHTGLKADIDLGGGFSTMISLMNPTDYTEFNPVESYTVGYQFGYETDAGGTWFNILYGDQDGDVVNEGGQEENTNTIQGDITAGYNLTDAFYLGLNATYNSTGTDVDGQDAGSFYGVAVYPSYAFSEAFALGVRAEYFAVDNFYLDFGDAPFSYDTVEGDGNVFDLTVSGNINIGNLRLIPELRMDFYSDDIIVNNNDELSNSLTSFLLAAVYSF